MLKSGNRQFLSENGTETKTQKKHPSPVQDHPYAHKVLESACEKIRTAPDGQRHKTRLDQASLLEVMWAGHLQEGEAECHLLEAALGNTDDPKEQSKPFWMAWSMVLPPLSPPQKLSLTTQQAVVNSSQTPNSESELYLFSEHGTARWKETHNGRILVLWPTLQLRLSRSWNSDDGEELLYYKIQGEFGAIHYQRFRFLQAIDSLCFVPEKYGAKHRFFHPLQTKIPASCDPSKQWRSSSHEGVYAYWTT